MGSRIQTKFLLKSHHFVPGREGVKLTNSGSVQTWGGVGGPRHGGREGLSGLSPLPLLFPTEQELKLNP